MKRGKKPNTIEINGRTYDTRTGLPDGSITKNPTETKVIDGFINPKSAKSRASATKRSQPAKADSIHSKPKKTRTLNRAFVARPRNKKLIGNDKDKSLASKVSTKRKVRAGLFSQSSIISKFKQPKEVVTPAKSLDVSSVAPPSIKPKITPKLDARRSSRKEQMISEAMTKSQPEKKNSVPIVGRLKQWSNSKPRAISIGAGAFTALLIVGFVVYLNVPNIALKVAASRAGFDAKMPGYQPAGFGFGGPIAYSDGQITLQYDSRADDRAFHITEKQTNWDSQSLLDNFVTKNTQLYQTYQERGLTIYVYEGDNATWVNGGIWFTVEGDSMLNAEQLIKIAASL